MASDISNINLSKLLPIMTNTSKPNAANVLSNISKADPSSMDFSVKNDPTALILQSAMEKINAQFAPYIGDGALQKAIDSGQDMSPKGVADSILSFATQLIGRAEAAQVGQPSEQQRSREQLFQNVQTGVETGFKQASNILESMKALNGKTKETVNSTYDYVQQGLVDLATLLGLQSSTKV